MHQEAINAARLKTWTKNFNIPDAVNVDVGKLLQASLDKIDSNPFKVKVVALINDSTGTLVKGAYIDPDCVIGLILGTGSNACYMERIDHVPKWTKHSGPSKEASEAYDHLTEVMINMEFGSFGDNGSIDFVKTKFDRQVDQNSLFPGSFTFEKYLGGHFLGETLRFVLLELVEQGTLLGGKASESLKTKDSVKSSDLSEIEAYVSMKNDQYSIFLFSDHSIRPT